MNPFTKSPFFDDYYRYCGLRPLSYSESYLFAESLTRPIALSIAKKLAQSFNISIKVEALSVRQFWIWPKPDFDDPNYVERSEPLLEWAVNSETAKWAVTLHHLEKKQLVDLWKCWNTMQPFSEAADFKEWFIPYKQGYAHPADDPALAIWNGMEHEYLDSYDYEQPSEKEELPEGFYGPEELNSHLRDDNYEDM